MRFLKKIVIANAIALLLFTGVTLFLSVKETLLPDSLIYSFFGAFGLENLVTAIIKVMEKKEGIDNDTEKIHHEESNVHLSSEDQTSVRDCSQCGDEQSSNERQAVG